MALRNRQDPWDAAPIVKPAVDPTLDAVVDVGRISSQEALNLRQGQRIRLPDGRETVVSGQPRSGVGGDRVSNEVSTVEQPWDEAPLAPIEGQQPKDMAIKALEGSPILGGQMAYQRGAVEQIPFSNQIIAGVGSLFGDSSYSEIRDGQRALADYDRENNSAQRNLGGIAGFTAGLALPGSAYVRGATGAQAAIRAGQVGGAYSGLYAAGTGEGGVGERLQRGAVGAATGAVVGAGLQGAGGYFAKRLGGIAGAAPRANPRADMAARVADFDQVGVDPTLAGVGGPVSQRTAQTLAGNIVTGQPIARAAQRAREQTTAARDRIAGQYGIAEGRDAAGRTLRGAAESSAQRMRTEGGALYQPVNALEGNTTPIPLTNAAAAIDDSLSVFTTPELQRWFTNKATNLSEFQNVLQSSGGRATFAEARRLRTLVGDMLKDPEVFRSASQAGLNRLYGALSDDIAEGARTLGGDEAAASLGRADTFWAASRARADNLLRQFYQTRTGRDVTDAESYNLLLSAAKTKGNRSSSNVVRQLRDSVTPEEWGDISGGIIRTLGGEGDDFSAAKFASEYEALTPEARRIMFGGQGREQEFADLNALVRVARQQERAGRFYNYSESGNTIGNITGASTLMTAAATGNIPIVIGIVGTGALGNGLARLLVTPGVARWAARPGREAIPQAERLARRNAMFGEWWAVNRDAVVRAVAQNDNAAIPLQSAASEEETRR